MKRALFYSFLLFSFNFDVLGSYSIFDLKGKALIKAGEGNIQRVNNGQILSNEEIIITNKRSSLSLLLSDYSYLNLGEDSVLKVFKDKGMLSFHLFRGKVRVFHSVKGESIRLITPVKEMSSKGKVTFVAEVFKPDEFVKLDLVMLRGSLYTEKQRIRSGMRYLANWKNSSMEEITPHFENRLVFDEKRFISKSNGERKFDFEVELEWNKESKVLPQAKREIASIDSFESYDAKDEAFDFEEESGPILVHETIHDEISAAAGKVMDKAPWFSRTQIKNIDYREIALGIAIDRIATKVFFDLKKTLEKSLYQRAEEFTDHLIVEDKTELKKQDLESSLWVLTSQYVDRKMRDSVVLSNQIFPTLKKEIQQKIFNDIQERSYDWSYGQALSKGTNSYYELIKKHHLNPPIGADKLIKKIAHGIAIDFSNRVAQSLSEDFASYQVRQAMKRATVIVQPVIKKKLKKLYQAKILTEVETMLSVGRARMIASKKEPEFDQKKIRYQNQEIRARNRKLIRSSR